MSAPPFARLYCFLSDNQERVVVLRKGPAKWRQLILWELEDDKITSGQWLHGSVYHDKVDISPSGKYISIPIAKYSLEILEDKDFHSWVCISKPPFFSALSTIFPKQGQARGGFFESDSHFIFNGLREGIKIKGTNPKGKMKISFRTSSSKMSISGENPLNIERLKKRGWIVTQAFEGSYHKTITPQIITKNLNSFISLNLEREVINFKTKNKYYLELNGVSSEVEGAFWMDFDFKYRILLAKEGKIFASEIPAKGESNINFVELGDFNAAKPEDIKPSDDYYKW